MVRVLHFVGGLDRGGIETFIMNIYRNIDRESIQFDFAVSNEKKGDYEDEITALGGKVFHIPGLSHPIKQYYQIKKLVKDGRYKIIHRHASNASIVWGLLAAKSGGAKCLIAHSHNTEATHSLLHKLCRPLLNNLCSEKFACSETAGIWMFGKGKFKVFPNAIDLESFVFDKSKRIKIREELDISSDAKVLGHIGRFVPEKNQTFLTDIFEEFNKLDKNSYLLLIGKGPLENSVKEYTQNKLSRDKILFLGARGDIPDILQAMDYFVMPSVYEGLPVTLIEAQANGLQCVVADTVTKEADVIGNTIFLSLSADASKWASVIHTTSAIKNHNITALYEAGFDVKEAAKRLENYYVGSKEFEKE